MRHGSFARFIASGLICLTPLLFGGVDQWVQLGGIGLMAIGFLAFSPRREAMPLFLLLGLSTCFTWLLFKDFFPLHFGAEPLWRETLAQDFQLSLGALRHPEPIRFLNTFLMLLAGVLWFWWIRSLQEGNEARAHFSWTLLIAAFLVAGASLLGKTSNPDLIFNLRYTPGYLGFGPFPNRNHTASLLAMGLLIGGGCLFETIRHRQRVLMLVCGLMIVTILQALFASGSRGGAIAAAGGSLFFLLTLFLRHKNFKILALLFGGILLSGSLFYLSDSKVLERVQHDGVNTHAVEGRIAIWKDTWKMIEDAPLLGHGLDLFPSVYPFYQHYGVTNHRILHPESSLLLLLSEWGLIAAGILILILAMMILPHLRRLPRVEHGFAYRAGAFAALAAIALHGCWDVPWHRWGTMLYALVVLTIACPSWMHSQEKKSSRATGWFLLPWILVGILGASRWIPGAPPHPNEIENLSLRIQQKKDVSFREIEQGLRWYPLSGDLHHYYGLSILSEPASRERAWNHFRVADQLIPFSWTMPFQQAVASASYSEAAACHFWTMAVERSGHRRDEILSNAIDRTAKFQQGAAFWRQYVENEPFLIPGYLIKVAPSDASALYSHWWSERASNKNWMDSERSAFYAIAARWGRLEQFQSWSSENKSLENQDYRAWANVYHAFARDDLAWGLLEQKLPPLSFPAVAPQSLTFLKDEWEQRPDNWPNIQKLVLSLHAQNEWKDRDAVIFSTAKRAGAPPWFRETAARILGERGDFSGAVEIILRAP